MWKILEEIRHFVPPPSPQNLLKKRKKVKRVLLHLNTPTSSPTFLALKTPLSVDQILKLKNVFLVPKTLMICGALQAANPSLESSTCLEVVVAFVNTGPASWPDMVLLCLPWLISDSKTSLNIWMMCVWSILKKPWTSCYSIQRWVLVLAWMQSRAGEANTGLDPKALPGHPGLEIWHERQRFIQKLLGLLFSFLPLSLQSPVTQCWVPFCSWS